MSTRSKKRPPKRPSTSNEQALRARIALLKRRLRTFEDALKPGVDAGVSKAAVKIRRRFAETMREVGWVDPTTAAAWRMALVRTGRCLEISDRCPEPCTISTPMDLCVVCAIHREGTLYMSNAENSR